MQRRSALLIRIPSRATEATSPLALTPSTPVSTHLKAGVSVHRCVAPRGLLFLFSLSCLYLLIAPLTTQLPQHQTLSSNNIWPPSGDHVILPTFFLTGLRSTFNSCFLAIATVTFSYCTSCSFSLTPVLALSQG